MDYRTGKCSQCGAEYKVPASFAHNVARCKVCKGVVHLGAPGAPAPAATHAPASSPPAAAAASTPSMPAKKVVPKPAAPSAPRPAVPDAKKTPPSAPARPAAASAASAEGPVERPKGGTLERLKTERTAGAPPPSTPAPKPVASTPAAKPAASTPARPVAAGARASATEDAGRARRERHPVKKEKKAPVAGIVSGIALVVVGAGVFLFKDQLFGGGGDAEAAVTPPVATTPAETSDETPTTPEPVTPDAGAPADREPVAGGDATAAGIGGDAPAAPADAPLEAPKPKGKDPSSVDLTALPDFQPTPDTTPEEWAQMQEWIVQWMDVEAGAAGNRAKLSLIGKGRKAMPVILNHFKTLDFATPQGRSNGDQCQSAMMKICNGTNFDWRYPDAAAGRPVETPDDVYFCKRVVELWSSSWKQAEENIEAWIRIAKLDEKDPAEAKRLREQFGGAQPASEEPASGSDDDLDVD